MMRLAVSHKQVQPILLKQWLSVGAKTGTAEKIKNVMIKQQTGFRVAAFPINDPEYLVFVMVMSQSPRNILMDILLRAGRCSCYS